MPSVCDFYETVLHANEELPNGQELPYSGTKEVRLEEWWRLYLMEVEFLFRV